MKITIYWRKDKIVSKTRHEAWQFWSDSYYFSCSLSSIHKRRRPERVFLGFAHYRYNRYRSLISYEYQVMGEFEVEERERYIKTIKQ